jgi:TM2 domain-containing membrane protein YozV
MQTTATVDPPLQSDSTIWKNPDREYFTLLMLSIFLGFFGVDHIYLRSFPTALLKTIVNCFTFGMWYIWDLIQIVGDSATIKQNGLNTPFDWIKGIGKGVIRKPGDPIKTAPRDYVIYALLALCLGGLGADKFYIGAYGQGIAKLLSCFNIFLFLFGLWWVLHDWVYSMFFEESVIKDGMPVPMPFSILFSRIETKDLFIATDTPQKPTSWSDYFMLPTFPTFLSFPGFGPLQEFIEIVMKPVRIGATVAGSVASDGQRILTETTQTLSTLPAAAVTAAQSLPPVQTGGGRSPDENGIGPVVAGSLAALLLAGGAKGFYDFIRKQL